MFNSMYLVALREEARRSGCEVHCYNMGILHTSRPYSDMEN